MTKKIHKSLNTVIHQPVRLQIMTFLHLAKKASFPELKKELEITDGNLGSHLTKLEAEKLVKIQKKFVAKKPSTTVFITEKGEEELINYVNLLKTLIG